MDAVLYDHVVARLLADEELDDLVTSVVDAACRSSEAVDEVLADLGAASSPRRPSARAPEWPPRSATRAMRVLSLVFVVGVVGCDEQATEPVAAGHREEGAEPRRTGTEAETGNEGNPELCRADAYDGPVLWIHDQNHWGAADVLTTAGVGIGDDSLFKIVELLEEFRSEEAAPGAPLVWLDDAAPPDRWPTRPFVRKALGELARGAGYGDLMYCREFAWETEPPPRDDAPIDLEPDLRYGGARPAAEVACRVLPIPSVRVEVLWAVPDEPLAVAEVARASERELLLCYDRVSLRAPDADLNGTVFTKLTVDQRGRVSRSVVTSSELGSIQIERCIAGVARRWTSLPHRPTEGGSAAVELTFDRRRMARRPELCEQYGGMRSSGVR